VNPDYKQINVESQLDDENSVLNYHKQLIRYRKDHKTLVYGDFQQVKTNKKIFYFIRKDEEEEYHIVCNLTKDNQKRIEIVNGELIFSNYPEHSEVLKKYEACVYKIKK